jgi:hypothetical protein
MPNGGPLGVAVSSGRSQRRLQVAYDSEPPLIDETGDAIDLTRFELKRKRVWRSGEQTPHALVRAWSVPQLEAAAIPRPRPRSTVVTVA